MTTEVAAENLKGVSGQEEAVVKEAQVVEAADVSGAGGVNGEEANVQADPPATTTEAVPAAAKVPSEEPQPSAEDATTESKPPVDADAVDIAVASEEVPGAKPVGHEAPEDSTPPVSIPAEDIKEETPVEAPAEPTIEPKPTVEDPPVEIPAAAAASTGESAAPVQASSETIEPENDNQPDPEVSVPAPDAETISEQVAEPAAKPAAEPAAEPASESVPEPVSEPASELASDLKVFTGELQTAVDSFLAGEQDGTAGLGGRKKIIAAAEKILGAVKDPGSQWMERSVQIGNLGAAHLFQVWGAFEQIPEEGSITFSDLAEKLDAETSVVERVSGVLLSSGMLKLVGTDSVAHTPKSRIFLNGDPTGVVYRLAWDNGMVPYFHLPAFFEKYGRKEPQQQTHIPATFARGHAEKTFWEVLAMDPAYLQRFLKGMSVIEGRSPAAGIYDFGWLVEKAKQESDRTVFVDVGGGKGHALLAIHGEFPDLPLDRMVLQDRPESIQAVEAAGDPSLAKVQKVSMDFHTDQPTKGAMVYFVRRCLHNYSDTIVVNILRVLAEAMAADSHLLIQEDVKSMPPDPDNAVLDFLMMTYGGKERTLQCWEDVLGKAGLKLVGVSQGSGPWASLSVIDCVKA